MRPASCSLCRNVVLTQILGSLLLGLAAVDAAGQSRTWHIGLCHVGLDHEPPSLPTLHQALNEMGYEDGKNLRFDWRNQADEAAAHVTAKEWVAAGVDLIVAFEDQCVRAAQTATAEIPIIMVHAFDPVAAGYIASLARPGGNITGPVPMLDVIAKRLEFLKQIGFRRVLLLADPKDPFTPRELERARNAAAALGLELLEREVTTAADVERVFDSLKPGEVEAVLPASPTIFTNFPSLMVRLAARDRLALVMHRKAWVERSALFSYAPDFAAAGPVAAQYIDRIVQGADPAELPVDELSQIIFTVNLKTAQALGLTIPPSILLRADEVIE
jgi:putative tryptophan/tyrosine transport system substrate-binding protein